MSESALPPRPSNKRKPLTDVSNINASTNNTRKSLRLQQHDKPSMIPMVSRSITNLASITEHSENEEYSISEKQSSKTTLPERRQSMIPSASVSALSTLKSTRRQSTAPSKPSTDTALMENYRQQIESLTTELSDEKQLTTDLEAENTSLLATIEQLQNKLNAVQPADHSQCVRQQNQKQKQLDAKVAELEELSAYNSMLEQQVTELQAQIGQSIAPTQKAARSKRLSMLSSSISSLAAVKEAEDEQRAEPAAAKRTTRRSSMVELPNCFEPISLKKK